MTNILKFDDSYGIPEIFIVALLNYKFTSIPVHVVATAEISNNNIFTYLLRNTTTVPLSGFLTAMTLIFL